MNKSYIYLDGKVIIEDENNNKTLTEYYDNLDEVLIQENLIETMEKRIKELEQEMETYKNCSGKRYIPVILPFTILLSTIGTPIVIKFLTGFEPFNYPIDTAFGTTNLAMCMIPIVLSISTIPFGALAEICQYITYKDSIKKEKAIISEMDFLNKEIEKGKEHLEKLKQEKVKNNENTEFRTVKVNDLQYLEALKSYLKLYSDLGYNYEKYYHFYQEGQLDQKLEKLYSVKNIKLAKEYFEEKGPTLIKK